MEVEVLPHRQLPVEGVLLGDDPAQLLGQRGVFGDVDASDEGPPGGRYDAGGEHAGRGRLARPVGTEQAEDLTSEHVEVELVDRREVGPRIDLRQLLGVDHRVGGSWRFADADRAGGLR